MSALPPETSLSSTIWISSSDSEHTAGATQWSLQTKDRPQSRVSAEGLCLRLRRIEGRQRGNIALDYCSCRQEEFFLKTPGDKLYTNRHAIG